jgi:hypothetical protein
MTTGATADTWEQRTDGDGWVHRVDRGQLLRPHVRADGTLLVDGFAAREGVLEYRQADGSTRRELVTRDTLEASAAGLARAPVTLEHPRVDVSPDNVRELGVGDTDGEVRVEDGGFVRVKLAVRRRDAIKAIRGGKHELSPGYRVRIDPTPGVHPVHGRYDAVQTARQYNHLAIVDVARGGPEVRMRTDSGDAVATTVIERRTDAGHQEAHVNPRFLRLLTLLGVTSRVDSDDAAIDAACGALDARRKDADAEHQRKLDAMTAERDAATARADAAEAWVQALEAAEATRADAAERTELDGLARELGVDPAKHADAAGLRRAIAAAHLGSALRDDASDEYVRALVDLAKAGATERDDGREAGRAAWQGGPPPAPPARTDAAPTGRPSLFQLAQRRGDALRKGATGGDA